MEKLNKVEQLKAILRKLREFKKQGGGEGIDQKIAEVQLELRRHLREQIEEKEIKEESMTAEVQAAMNDIDMTMEKLRTGKIKTQY